MSRPAPALRSVAALAAHDLRVTARRGENVLVTLVIPIAVLLFFASTPVVPVPSGDAVRKPLDVAEVVRGQEDRPALIAK